MTHFFRVLPIWVFTALVAMPLFAQRQMPPTQPLSSSAYITLITCDPGDQLYSTFGHSAIGVIDPEQGINWVFNYGTFNFEVPHFYSKFVSGKLLYQLSYGSKERFLYEYKRSQRRVTEDVLNLTESQKQKLFDHLKNNYLPENREYQYDFFFDNCATRIVDLVYEALGDSLVYHADSSRKEITYRNLIDIYLPKSHWSDFGIDLALGSVIDKPANPRQQAFLPDYLRDYLSRCTINDLPFFTHSQELVSESAPLPETAWYVRPGLLFWLVFISFLVFSIVLQHKSWIIADRILFASIGILGVVILLLWVATDHDATAGNLNLLWANPLYLIYAFCISSKKGFCYAWGSRIVVILNSLVLLGWFIIPQEFNLVFIPIIATLLLRGGVHVMRSYSR
ncbi:MAG: DUF4105 domain-containing protein [Salinivirgaceae bacterium]|jgi:hypothetical protein